MAGVQGRDNKKREPWQYVLLAALLLAVWFVPQVYELRGEGSALRLAVAPIKVLENGLTYPCYVLPLQVYAIGADVFDDEVDPLHEWKNIRSVTCRGIVRR